MSESISISDLEKLKFPIGKFQPPFVIDNSHLENYINTIQNFPEKLKLETKGLSDQQLNTPYRPEGWTIRQVVHHCADSHMNSLIRFKLALTEDTPTIRPYHEELWAELPDSSSLPIQSSIKMLEGIHERWSFLLKNISDVQWNNTFIHPADKKQVTLKENVGIYAWHCDHHLAHITTLKKAKGW